MNPRQTSTANEFSPTATERRESTLPLPQTPLIAGAGAGRPSIGFVGQAPLRAAEGRGIALAGLLAVAMLLVALVLMLV
ncbi:hypothetical protein [Haliangium ochraceum]|uniref:Uncharacterized protein n=1 Tax=Haliangium ochraceum (strain DSM 14365 / JCM 11303 / SMP-2) TaxID=502025 RepID=D0LZR5_HALO1|nr:hypothetical protein [Haliangium ochraceum]ACY18044.1 hypothetical protein Hoch_5562 [Haliangium ochraceum DSM 14365]